MARKARATHYEDVRQAHEERQVMKATKALGALTRGVGILTLAAGAVLVGVLAYASIIKVPRSGRNNHV